LFSVDVPGVCPAISHAVLRDFAVQKQLNGSSLLGVETIGHPRNTVLDRDADCPTDSMQPSSNHFDQLFSFEAIVRRHFEIRCTAYPNDVRRKQLNARKWRLMQ